MIMHYLYIAIIGIVAGWLAGQISKGSGFGLIGNLIVGIIGAVIGGLLFGLLGFQATNTLGRLISATVGAIVLLVLIVRFGPKR
jgi:uncharacterized membrane protein YeaQ/YmgE (transglycosylase-associated protein family)